MTRAPPAEGPFNVLMVSFITLETDLAVHSLLQDFFFTIDDFGFTLDEL